MFETPSLDLAAGEAPGWARFRAAARGPVISSFAIGLVIVAWEVGVRVFGVREFILPAPSVIVRDTAAMGWGIVPHIEATLVTIFAGYGLAFVLSLPLAIALSSSRFLSHALYPLLVIKQSVPVVALAPILTVVLGAGEAPRIAITTLIALFPLVVSTATGLSSTPMELVELSQSMGVSRMKQLMDIRLPAAVPFIFSGLKISMTLSVVGAIVGEFVAAERGLGYLIYTSTAYFHMSIAFGAMFILSAIGLLLFQGVLFIERHFFPWALAQAPDAE